jgi:hypothetical protein
MNRFARLQVSRLLSKIAPISQGGWSRAFLVPSLLVACQFIIFSEIKLSVTPLVAHAGGDGE